MKKYSEILKACPLFYDITEENLFTMLDCLGAKLVEFDRKFTIFAEGHPAKHIGIMLSGRAQVMRIDYFGNRSIVSEVRSSEIFGAAFACGEVSCLPVDVVAAEPCEVMLIDCSHILHTCSNNCAFHQQLIFNLMKDLATKNLELYQRMEITSKRTTREKLMSYLILCAKKTGKSSFDIPFDRQELADYLEVDRSGLSAEIGKMRKDRIIESSRKHFELL